MEGKVMCWTCCGNGITCGKICLACNGTGEKDNNRENVYKAWLFNDLTFSETTELFNKQKLSRTS